MESFLKMFYLIFGQAYSRNYLEVDTYNKLCVNKDTKIGMPKLKGEEECDGSLWAKSLQEGVDAAYKAVMKPAEGTILTVSRLAAAKAHEAA